MTHDALSQKLADLVCDALNSDLSASMVMAALSQTTTNLADFMFNDPQAYEFMDGAETSVRTH